MKKTLLTLITTIVATVAVCAANLGDPVCFKALENNSDICIWDKRYPVKVSYEYCTNGGAWQDYTCRTYITLNAGETVSFRSKSDVTTGSGTGLYSYYYFYSTKGKWNVSGDVTTLINKNGKVNTLSNYCFNKLFDGNTHIVDASELLLPSETIGEYAYYCMFNGCANLQKAPKVGAKSLARYSCGSMFYGCSLINKIEVSFTDWNGANYGTYNWLYGVSQTGDFICPTGLPATRGASYIPDSWTVRLNVHPADPVIITATQSGSNVTLKIGGYTPPAISIAYSTDKGATWYGYKFGTVIQLQNVGDDVRFCNTSESPTTFSTGSNTYYCFASTAGKIKASGDVTSLLCQNGKVDRLENYTFCGLFYKNTFIEDASGLKLPSTTLAYGCYYDMFDGCTNITAAPELPATELAEYCYQNMFYNCSKLSSIKVAFSNWRYDISATKNWVYNVSQSGTFICPKGLERKRDAWHIPAGWKVPIDLKPQNPVCITAVDAGSNVALKIGGGSPTVNSFAYSTDNGANWYDYILGTVITLSNANDKVLFCNTSENPTSLGISENAYYKFESTAGKIKASGDVTSLLCQNGKVDNLTQYTFCGLFYYNEFLADASELELPSTTLAAGCYYQMFKGCKNLTAAPKLPAERLAWYCYMEMFEYCPQLNSIEVAFSDWFTDIKATKNWLYDVSKSGTFICPNGLKRERGAWYIPNGWQIPLDIKPEEPLCFTANVDGSDIKITTKNSPNPVGLAYSLDGTNWYDYELNTNITLTKAGDKIYFCNSSVAPTNFSTGQFTYYYFVSSKGDLSVSGDITTLLRQSGKVDNLPEYAFNKLFIENTYISDASQLKLPSAILSKECYYAMFDGCTSLTKIPELKTATLAPYCYGYMFHKCKIATAPELKATTLAEGCYHYMFAECSSLTQAPDLPAERIVKNCYESMFYKCTSIEKAPVIKAKKLAPEACEQMFYGCSKLNYVEVNFDEWDEDNYATYEWLEGVAANGTYKCSDELEDNIDEYDGSTFPESWIREAPIDIDPENPVCFTSNADDSDIMIAKKGSPSIVKLAYSFDGETWFRYRFDTSISLAKAGDKVIFCNINEDETKFSTSKTDYYKFVSTKGNLSVSGDVTSLLCESGNVEDLPDYTFANLFNGNTFISDASKLELPSTDLGSHCYYAMFDGCSSLTTAPDLPAEKVAESCYANMFEGCAKLAEAPELNAVMLEESCFAEMFKDCKSLETAPVIKALSLDNASCFRMFSGCEKLNHIEVSFKSWNLETYDTYEWLAGVSATGTFKCPDVLFNSIETRDGSTFPEGWIREVPTDAEEIEADETENGSDNLKILTRKGLHLIYPDGRVTNIMGIPTELQY